MISIKELIEDDSTESKYHLKIAVNSVESVIKLARSIVNNGCNIENKFIYPAHSIYRVEVIKNGSN